MKISALLLTLIPSCALAQGVRYEPLAPMYRPLGPNAALSPVVAHYVWDRSGPMLEEPAGTVSHVYWNGTQLVDTKGLAWTMQGTVPQVANSILYPDGFAGASRKGAGPFSASNYYAGPTTMFNAAPAFNVLAVVNVTDTATAQVIFAKDDVGSNRVFSLDISAVAPNGVTCAAWINGVLKTRSITIGLGVHVVGCMYDGAEMTTWLDGVSSAAIAATGPVDTYSVAPSIGRRMHSSSQTPFLGNIYQMIIGYEAAGATFMQTQARRFLNLYAQKPPTSVVTWTRAASQSCQPVSGGALGTVPAGAPCVGANGAGVWGAVTQSALKTDAFNTAGTWNAAGGGVLPSTKTTDPMLGSMADVWSQAPGYQLFQSVSGLTAGQTYTESFFVKTASGTCDSNISMTNCATWNGASVKGFTATTTWQRVSLSAIPAASATCAGIVVGAYSAGTGQSVTDGKTPGTCTLHLFRANTTPGSILYPPIAADNLPVLSVADAPTVASALVDWTRFSRTITVTPSGAWNVGSRGLFTLSPYGATNSASAYVESGVLRVEVNDGLTSNWKRWTASNTLTGTAATTFKVAYSNGDVTGSYVVAGVETPFAFTTSGDGSGILEAAATTDYLGVVGSSVLNGYIREYVQCKTARYTNCKTVLP